MTRKSELTITLVRKGRRTYGGIYTLPSGKRCYLAYRRRSEIFRSGEATISGAIAKGVASWALDDETCIQLRAQGVEYAGVLVRETGEKYVTRLDNFFDRSKVKIMNYESRGGALQRYLPLSYFLRSPGKISKL